MHALPRLSTLVLADRARAERVDASAGSWRVYAMTAVVCAAVAVACWSLSVVCSEYNAFARSYPIHPFGGVLAVDVVGATATLVVPWATAMACVFHQRGRCSSLATTLCLVLDALAAGLFVPCVLMMVMMARFGIDA